MQERKNKKKLLSWLKNTPVYLTLQWFDVVEEAKVSSNLLSRRWTTEITERDKLFLEKLGGGYLPLPVPLGKDRTALLVRCGELAVGPLGQHPHLHCLSGC